ncbi:uncharacterized protein LOC110666922 isoform X2 [Hevea brasiliensis]|nr:uncharacterized protein LOC110666922 isoform X2 [Hevea brasiliensis]XP_058008286.1 uncharacterized protein LOC110666922 isoform X2 [Hevea brasiliensis]XP_058008287.1 uncharacterized protein LOC110666922 isoform X2 [Hevea brasiliensis]
MVLALGFRFISVVKFFLHSTFKGRSESREASLFSLRSMVFRSASETHQTSPHRDATKYADMASSTLKSHQPLHNFPLQDLKWSMNHTNNHRFRKFAADSSHKSPQRDTAESDGVKTGNYVASPDRVTEKSEKKLGPSDTAVDNSDRKSKIFIRIRTNSSKCADDSVDAGDQTSVVDDAEETITKTWNLRPRRAVIKASDGNGGVPKICGAVAPETKAQEPSRPELTRSRNTNDAKVAEKKEKEKEKKLKLSIPLTKEEIEEDVYALTGSKPARRPKKRPKHVQKQLDCLFPGLWLSSITPDVYKVSDAPPKG